MFEYQEMASESNDKVGSVMPKVECVMPKVVVSTTQKDATSKGDVENNKSQNAAGASKSATESKTTQLVALPRIKLVGKQTTVGLGGGDTTKKGKASTSKNMGKSGDATMDVTKTLRVSSAKTAATSSPTDDVDDLVLYECNICKAFFTMISSLKQHVVTHTKKADTEICSKCGYFQPDGDAFHEHTCHVPKTSNDHSYHKPKKAKKKHKKSSPKSKSRSKSSVFIERARRGRWIAEVDISPPKPVDNYFQSCSACNKFFSTPENMEKHVKDTHTGVNTAVCHQCGYFESDGGLLRPHLCQTESQQKVASNRVERKQMQAIKKKDKTPVRHKCRICSKSYAYLNGLRAHMYTHKPPSEKPYHCHHCGKGFSKKILFQDHSRIHTGEKPYLCHLCAKSFRSGANLRQHARRCKQRKMAAQKETPVTYELAMEVYQDGVETFFIHVDPTQGRDNNGGKTNSGNMTIICPPGVSPSSGVKLYNTPHTTLDKGTQGNSPANMTMEEDQQRMEIENNQDAANYHGNDSAVDEESDADFESERQETTAQVLREVEVATEQGTASVPSENAENDYVDCTFPEPPTPAPPAGTAATDHDYSKDHQKKVLEEHPVGDNIQATEYVEVFFMCTKCYILHDSKMDHRAHMQMHGGKKGEVSEGIVVLARPQEAECFEGGEEDIIPLKMFYQCSHCNKPFTVDDIEEHLDNLEVTDNMCNICYRVHKKPMKAKCKLSRARKVYQCPYCKSSPMTRFDLKNHLTTKHTGSKNTYSECLLCHTKFKGRRGLASHMPIHRRKPRDHARPLTRVERKYYPCSQCDKVLSHRTDLRIHLMHHTDPKPFPCKLCPKKYSFPSALRVHMRGHNNSFPYMCEFCSKTFKVKACLLDHIRCHTGDKPFICETCGKAFRTKANMRQHSQRCPSTSSVPARSVATTNYSEGFYCQRCGKVFNTKDGLTEHNQSCAGTLVMQQQESIVEGEADNTFFVIIPQDVTQEEAADVESSYQEVTMSVNAAPTS